MCVPCDSVETAKCCLTVMIVLVQAMQKEFEAACKRVNNILVTYEDDEITLSIPMDGVKQGGWSLLPIQFPMVSP